MALLTVEEIRASLPDTPDEELEILIEDAEAIAALYAPCITSPVFKQRAAAKAIIRKAIVYDVKAQEEGNNVVRERTGPYDVEYRTPTRSGAFYSKQQVEALKALCPQAAGGVQSIKFASGH